MCGIFCSLSRNSHISSSEPTKQLLHARGPDASNELCFPPRDDEKGHSTTCITMHSTVLSLRGETTVSQPFRYQHSGGTLCWNGEAWSIAGEQPDGNDTELVFKLLDKAAREPLPPMDGREELEYCARRIAQALSQVTGPYAFVFHSTATCKLYFGRDFLGRRSLLRRITEQGDVLFSSVANGATDAGSSEVEADGVYCIDLAEKPYSRDAPDACLQKLADYFVARVPHMTRDSASDNITSVLPQLSLNRDLPKSSSALTEHSASVQELQRLLTESLIPRVTKIPDPPRRTDTDATFSTARLAVLFSGGLDCTTLARMSHDLLPASEPIDLLNVAFENPRIHKSKGEASYELCPDRITGRSSYAELCHVCPDREWRFVAINVPYTETQEHRKQVITLMHPHNTEMDLSIAFALYFAARGTGLVEIDGEPRTYTSSARVLLSGLGADELFAGYTRHATAYKRGGFAGLLDELDLDIGRLGKRNLGRDDRVISHWSREVRFPFLDEKLVGWALQAPVTDKCDFGATVTEGSGDDVDDSRSIEPGKKALRCLAWKLGMRHVAKEKKRAIQFGARTAKMETGKTKGTTLLS